MLQARLCGASSNPLSLRCPCPWQGLELDDLQGPFQPTLWLDANAQREAQLCPPTSRPVPPLSGLAALRLGWPGSTAAGRDAQHLLPQEPSSSCSHAPQASCTHRCTRAAHAALRRLQQHFSTSGRLQLSSILPLWPHKALKLNPKPQVKPRLQSLAGRGQQMTSGEDKRFLQVAPQVLSPPGTKHSSQSCSSSCLLGAGGR